MSPHPRNTSWIDQYSLADHAQVAWTYLLLCADGTYYVGSTTNIEARLWQHNHGPDGAAYTRRRRPVRLVWTGEFSTAFETFAFEKQVQGWGRAEREALIRGDFDPLPGLASRARSRK